MRRTLATFDRAATKWIRAEDTEVTPPPASFPETFASLLRSTSDAAVTQALVALGLGPEPLEDVEKLVKTLQSYVLVVVGPAASEFWCRQPSDSDSTPHVQAICAFCETFCLHGSCEHTHAAFLDLELMPPLSLLVKKRSLCQSKTRCQSFSLPVLCANRRSCHHPGKQLFGHTMTQGWQPFCGFISWICGGLRSSSNISLLSSLLPFRSQMLALQRPLFRLELRRACSVLRNSGFADRLGT